MDNTDTVQNASQSVNQNASVQSAGGQTAVVEGNDNKVNISSIVEDNSGGLSSMRILMLAWGLGVLGIWGTAWVIAMVHGVYTAPTLPPEIVTILLGTTGIKCVQRYGEK